MSDVGGDRAGTWRDWPVAVIVVGMVLAFLPNAGLFAFLVFWGGVLALLIRRGVFAPRRR